MAGAFGVQLLLTIFFMPETTYKRNTDPGVLDTPMQKLSTIDEKKESVSEVENTVTARDGTSIPEKHSFIHELRPWSGYYDSSGFLYSIYAPFKMLGSPVVIWGCFLLTICLNWLVLLANTQSQIFSGPPYNFSVAQVGLTNLSSFVGTFIATALAGLIVDGLAKFMAGRNQGVYGKFLSCSYVHSQMLIHMLQNQSFVSQFLLYWPPSVPVDSSAGARVSPRANRGLFLSSSV